VLPYVAGSSPSHSDLELFSAKLLIMYMFWIIDQCVRAFQREYYEHSSVSVPIRIMRERDLEGKWPESRDVQFPWGINIHVHVHVRRDVLFNNTN
jgi:hypothetical protein